MNTLTSIPKRVMLGLLAGCAAATSLAALTAVSGPDFTLTIDRDQVWGWGNNAQSQLGAALATPVFLPQRLSFAGSGDWRDLALGTNHRLIIDGAGVMYGWGENSRGQLGTGGNASADFSTRNTPVLVADIGKSWKLVAAGEKHTVALASDGTVWVWGSDSAGQLGEANNLPPQPGEVFFNAPLQYPGLQAISVAAGKECTLVVTMAGELYGFGSNGTCQLGKDVRDLQSSRVKVRIGSASNWERVYAQNGQAFAINTNKELFSWGIISSAHTLGKDATKIISPTKILSGIKDLAACDTHVVAIGTDGTLKGWGSNANGQLKAPAIDSRTGQPVTSEYFRTPMSVSSLTDWVEVTVGKNYTVAFRNGDEAFAAGVNPVGQLGTNKTIFVPGSNTFIGLDETRGFAPASYKVGDPAISAVSIVTQQAAVSASAPMEVDVRVVNSGYRILSPQAGQLRLQLYLSADTKFDSADILFGSAVEVRDILAPNAETVKRIAATPTGVQKGSYYVIARLLLDPSLTEAKDDNNIGVSSEVRAFLADLVPEITSSLPTSGLQVGGQFTLQGNIRNVGNLSADVDVIASALLRPIGNGSEQPQAITNGSVTVTTGSLAAGASTPITIIVNIGKDIPVDTSYSVGLRVDSGNALTEISESNNETYLANRTLSVISGILGVPVTKSLDLLTVSPGVHGIDGFGGSEVNAILASYGKSTARAWTGVGQDVDTDISGGSGDYSFVQGHGARPPVTQLNPGETADFSLEVAGPATIEFTWALASENDVIAFTVDGAPPQDATQSSTINGNAGLVRYRYLLESNQAKRVLRWTFTKGSGSSLSAFIDSMLIKREVLPDLKITDLQVSKYESNATVPDANKNFIIGRSQALEITAYGFNAGRALSVGSVSGAQQFSAEVRLSTDRVWGNADDYVLGVLQQINGLDEGQRFLYGQTFIMDHCIPEGQYYLAVKIDNDGNYNEYDESNNVRFSTARDIVIESRPNLAVYPARVARPGVYYRLSEVPIEFEVTNTGCKDIPPGAVVEYTFGFYGNVISRSYVEQTLELQESASLPLEITQRNYGKVSDNRGIRAGETRLIRSSLQVPRYNEGAIMQFLYGDSGRDWTNYIPLPVEVIEPMALADTTSPVGLFDEGQGETSVDMPAQFRFFYQRDPILLNLYTERSSSVPLVWDVVRVWTYWPRDNAMYVGAIPANQTYEEFREFWTFRAVSLNRNPDPFTLNGSKLLNLDEAAFGDLGDDPDGDGLSNEVEWAFGLDPTRYSTNNGGVFSNVGAMALSSQSNPQALSGQEFLSVTFNALSAWSNGVFTYVVEASDTPDFQNPDILAVYTPGMSAQSLRQVLKSYDFNGVTANYRPVVEVIENGYLFRITVADYLPTTSGSRFMRVRLERAP